MGGKTHAERCSAGRCREEIFGAVCVQDGDLSD